ncbi:hypothetical protein ABZ639_17065 [Saccharomonospora sp. NPDC006951]
MAKQAIPGIQAGGGMLPKVIGIVVLIALGVIVVKHPTDAATWVKDGFSGLGDVIDGVVSFIRGVSA